MTLPAWSERYAALVDRKRREAQAAELAPLATDTVSDTTGLLPVGNDWSRRLFDGPFYVSPPPSDHLPAVGLVFVQSREGNTSADDPSALGGGESDKHLIYEGLSRVAADAVLAGAETVRGADIVFSVWRDEMVQLRNALGKPRHPVQVVATLRGIALEDQLLFNVPALQVVLLTIPEGATTMQPALATRPWITTVVMDRGIDLAVAFQTLRRTGLEYVSAVGGRTIASALLDAGLVQDVYVTTSPKAGGEPNTPMYERPLETRLVVRKLGTYADAGVRFEHLRIPSH